MATISENIQRINKAKTDIKNAIIAKGGSVADNDKIDTYAQAIEALPSGGGAELPQNLSRLVTDDWGNPKKITIKGSVEAISDNAFKNGQLEDVIIGNGVTTIGSDAFGYCSKLTGIVIPDSVTTIGGSAFQSCSSLTGIVIPDSVTSIGDEAFYHCQSLTGLTIPDGVTTIGDKTFYGCSSLTNIVIPDSVTSIGDNAFQSCSSLRSITIPDNVTSIGMFAFFACRNLAIITIKATTPPSLVSGAMDMTNITAIYVPSDSVDTYKSASGWSKYADKIQPIQE